MESDVENDVGAVSCIQDNSARRREFSPAPAGSPEVNSDGSGSAAEASSWLDLLPTDILARVIQLAYTSPVAALLDRGTRLPVMAALHAALPLVVWDELRVWNAARIALLVRAGLVAAVRRLFIHGVGDVAIAQPPNANEPAVACFVVRRLATAHLREAELELAARAADCVGDAPLAELLEALWPAAAGLQRLCLGYTVERTVRWSAPQAAELLAPFGPTLRELCLRRLRLRPPFAAGLGAALSALASLVIEEAPLETCSGAASLARLPALRRLRAAFAAPQALADLRPLALESLDATFPRPNAEASAAALGTFALGPSRRSLRRLRLDLPAYRGPAELPAPAAEAVALLQHLEELHGPRLRPEAAACVAGLPRLRALHARFDGDCAPAALEALAKRDPPPPLEELRLQLAVDVRALRRCRVFDALASAASALASLPTLRAARVELRGPGEAGKDAAAGAARLLAVFRKLGLAGEVCLSAEGDPEGRTLWEPEARAALEEEEPRLRAHWPAAPFPACPDPRCPACPGPSRPAAPLPTVPA